MALFKFGESRDARYIEELKNSTLPIYIYGGGIMAAYILKKFQRNKINFKGYVIDDEYFNSQKNCIKKSELEKIGERYFLVIAIEKLNNVNSFEIQSDFENCAGVYQFTSVLEDGGVIEYLTKEFYEGHSNRIDSVYNALCDDFSKKSFEAYLHARIEENISKINGYVIKPGFFFKTEFWQFNADEILVDGGAFDGDTITGFVELTPFVTGGGKSTPLSLIHSTPKN